MTATPSTTGRGHARVYALLMVMVFTWGLNFVIGKVALREMPGEVVASWRTPLSGVFILPLYFWGNREVKRQYSRHDLAVLLGLGIGGVIGNQVLFVLGLARTSVAHASIAVAMTPIFVLTFATFARQEHLTARKVAGMLLAASGIVALQFGREVSGRGPTLAGDLIVLLSAAVFAAYAVFGKSVASRFGSLTTNTFAYAGGGLLMLPVTWYLATQHDLSRVSTAAWLSVVYMAIFPAVIGYLIFYYALQRLPASRVAVFSYFQPVLATALAWALLGERPGPAFALAWGMVLSGVLLTERG